MTPRRPHSETADAVAFEQLLRPHVEALYRHAYRWTGAVDRAEDLVQELLTRLYPKLDELRRLERIRPWALRVMYRIFVDELRRERRSPVRPAAELWPDGEPNDERVAGDPAGEPPTLAERELTQARLLEAWERLGEDHRIVLSMHDIEGYSLPELASMIEVPLGTLKSRLHRARARLRELLAAEPSAGSVRVNE